MPTSSRRPSAGARQTQKQKSKALEEAERLIESLEAEIEELAATSATLSQEIEGLKKEIADKKLALKKVRDLVLHEAISCWIDNIVNAWH